VTQLDVYETCGAVADALPPTAREVFAMQLIARTLHGRPHRPPVFARVSAELPEVVRPMLLPLIQQLRGGGDSPRRAARRWLRDAGWVRA
jgi:hypothetical protein